ncbi:hypothetical protein ABL78_8014 [Leptomonas seymouri]|uniref:Uncharacterized protein n=1 Tax=Leptomonas seymouri TaxID=5684 RepID=A0A0N0P2H8_LEPSE|nr:hypothetical protein ABL78_8014 [Leptomonas seymouri]|eukprot:KPI82969.1 hypothetical protein ABL78_8014 [Leptomonas seymouri]
MTASVSAIASAQTGHPITRVATLPSSNASTILLVCAGGSSVSVQLAPRWLTSSVDGGDASNGTAAVATGGLQHLRHNSLEPQAATAAEAGKGADALLAAVQQWCAHRQSESATLSDTYGCAFSSSTRPSASPAPALAAEQRSCLRAGEVTSLCVATLPGTDTSLAVVGSTVGTIAMFLIEGGRTLCKVTECALVKWSRGGITAQDAVIDVAISMDPAGRPEFVSAASAGCVVVVDVKLLCCGDDDDGGGMERRITRGEHDDEEDLSQRAPLRPTGGDDWSTSALRAKAIDALERPNAQLLRRSRSEVFVCTFAEANVVRILAPQRLQAAVAMDVALVVVLSDGTLRYVERVMEGGSVRLLAEHHRLRFAKGSTFITYASDSMHAAPSSTPGPSLYASRVTEQSSRSAGGAKEMDSRAFPHVIYRYRLSPYQVNVCRLSGIGSAQGGGPAVSSAPSSAEGVTLVNDAALYFSEKDAVCHVMVAGTQLVPMSRAVSRSSPHAALGSGMHSAVDLASSAAAGWTLGRMLQENGALSSSSIGGGVGSRALGWWAVVHNAVLPRFTFDRAALERQAFQQHQRNQQVQQQSSTQSSLGPSSAQSLSRIGESAAAYSADSGSPFTIHVQSNVMALPAALPSAASSLSMNAGRQVAAAASGLDGAGLYDALPASPAVSSPTGTGAHVAASNTSAGVGNGFAAAAMVAGVLVLSAGADVYVGDVSEVSANARSLPMLRPLRSFGAVVENISFGPYRDTRSVLVATGSCVVPVAL